jgi:hypothetical protein
MPPRDPVALVISAALIACSPPPLPTVQPSRFEVLQPNLFRYTEWASELHPLDSEQAEHSRRVHLDEHVKGAHLCPAGYRIIERNPPMAYGTFNREVTSDVVTPVTYTGECLEGAAPP